jgi:hypothetical protein
MEGILGLWGGSFLHRSFYCAYSRHRYGHVVRGRRHSVEIDMVLVLRCLACGVVVLLGLDNFPCGDARSM